MRKYNRIIVMLVTAFFIASAAGAQTSNSADFSSTEEGNLFLEYEYLHSQTNST